MVADLFSSRGGDADILEYITGILEDEHFDFGPDGQGAFEHVGPFLVRLSGSVIGTALPPGACTVSLALRACMRSQRSMPPGLREGIWPASCRTD